MWEPSVIPAKLELPPLGADCEYRRPRTGAAKILKYEKLVFSWLQKSKPGSFSSRDAGAIYREAHRLFTEASGRTSYHGNTIDSFEVALSNRISMWSFGPPRP